MLRLLEEINVARSRSEVFNYVRDFTTTREWDATVIEANKVSAGPIRVDSQFIVRCAMPLGSVVLKYQITQLQKDVLIGLRGEGALFTVVDTISLHDSDDGCLLRYQADFHFKPYLQPFEQRFLPGLQRMGKASVEGLRAALDEPQPLLKNTRHGAISERLVLPGLRDFTAQGYKSSSKRFKPMSASMHGRHVVLTGGSSGIGYAAAMRMAELGADLTLLLRDAAKAKTVCGELNALGDGEVRAEIVDMASMRDVDAVVQRLLARGRAIDVLVNNAGALLNKRATNAEGLEYSLALLLLGPYQLTEGLRPLLQSAAKARVVNVVSGGLYTQRLSLPKLFKDEPSRYNGSVAYAQAKRALLLATVEQSRRWLDSGVVVNAMHPGWADTPGVAQSLPRFHKLTRACLRDAAQGADTVVWLAAANEAETVSGKLFLDRQIRRQYLLPGTRETLAERQLLFQILAHREYEDAASLDAKLATIEHSGSAVDSVS